MPAAPNQRTYRVTIQPEPGAVSEYTRLKALLKRVLHGYRWRCISLTVVKAADPDAEAERAAARLSKRQKALFLDLAALHDRADRPGLWGRIPFRWFRPRNQDRTRSESAAFSRALRTLEARGLLLRVNEVTGGFYDESWDRVRTRADQAPPQHQRSINSLETPGCRQTVNTDPEANVPKGMSVTVRPTNCYH